MRSQNRASLSVCTRCRQADFLGPETRRPGYLLARLSRTLHGLRVVVPPTGQERCAARCWASGKRRDADRGGSEKGGLAKAIRARFSDSAAARRGMSLRGVRCMSLCKRPCAIALSGASKYTLLFGDLDPNTDVEAILELARQYADAPDGLVARADRPEPLRAGILGRVPPLHLDGGPIDPDFTVVSSAHDKKEEH